jgi:hypothetical protein
MQLGATVQAPGCAWCLESLALQAASERRCVALLLRRMSSDALYIRSSGCCVALSVIGWSVMRAGTATCGQLRNHSGMQRMPSARKSCCC